MKKNVLVLASTFPRWPNDTTPPFIFELEKRLTSDFNIFILAPHFQGAKKSDTHDNLSIARFQYFWPAKYQKLCYEGGILPNLKKNKFLYIQAVTLIFFEFISAIKTVRKEKINLTHAHWIIPQGIVAYGLKKLLGIPYIVTTHGGDFYGLQNGILKYMKKKILENAAKITVVSTAIKREILKTINKNLTIDVIPMGVDSKLFNPDKYDLELKEKYKINGPFLLFVGRLAENKGIKYLLNAMPKIVDQFPNTKLIIIGQGVMEKQLKELSTDLEIDKNVFFSGPIINTQLPKYYATADVYIGPSIKTANGEAEGFGLTFVEASFSGCSVIGTNVGGIPDIVENGKNGFLIKEKSSESITNAILKLLTNKKITHEMKKNSRTSFINKFDWRIISQKYKNIYESDF